MELDELLRSEQRVLEACATDPGLWNLLAAEREWLRYGDACDPLSSAAPEHLLKLFQRDLYLDLWRDPLSRVAVPATTLVAGGGTGRFATILAAAGHQVELVDASPQAVQRARQHLGEKVTARVGDLTRPTTLPAAAYDLVLAVEVPCYATIPSVVLQHLRGAIRDGGTLLYSVEARPGALLGDRDLATPAAFTAVIDRGVATFAGHKHVHYYERDEAAALAEKAGFEVLAVEGVCYVPDGPFDRLVDAARLHDPEHLTELRAVERRCREHPLLRELPRAWAVTACAV